ncbi:MAG: alanine racemase [Lachnospiraceae bacterium]|nr:alanine racemase [Lachnospiraceae bacterium]
MKQNRRLCAEINLDHFEHNLNEIQRLISPDTKICAVIKTDGYGHGAAVLARMMEERDAVWGYAVATVEEAEILRRFRLKKPILILGYVFDDDRDVMIDLDIRPTVFSYEIAAELSEAAAKKHKTVNIHIKLDTGMGRIGFQCTPESVEEIVRIAALPHIRIEGIFTHFARADEKDKTFSAEQFGRYAFVAEQLRERGVKIPVHHVSNSAGIIDLPEYNLDLVRAGIILYGLWPSDEVKKERIDLKPLLTLKSHVVHVKTLPEGSTIGYGGTYVLREPRRIATIPAGYGDGYPRALSNRGYVLIRGKRAPIRGRVCMDQFMVDVTEIDGVWPGDEVILVGRDQDEEITMEQIGVLSGRFNYEFACDLGKRIPRVYYRRGKVFAAPSAAVPPALPDVCGRE